MKDTIIGLMGILVLMLLVSCTTSNMPVNEVKTGDTTADQILPGTGTLEEQMEEVMEEHMGEEAAEEMEEEMDEHMDEVVGSGRMGMMGDYVSTEDLSTHNLESDCWVAYDGEVYDISGFLGKHKGGMDVLIPLCGTSDDFQSAFSGKHGTSKVETLIKEGISKGMLG